MNDYECLCVPGYQDKNCETDIDECETGICRNHGNCTVSISTTSHYYIIDKNITNTYPMYLYVHVYMTVIYLEHKWLVHMRMY